MAFIPVPPPPITTATAFGAPVPIARLESIDGEGPTTTPGILLLTPPAPPPPPWYLPPPPPPPAITTYSTSKGAGLVLVKVPVLVNV
jgi:hypothetical protein